MVLAGTVAVVRVRQPLSVGRQICRSTVQLVAGAGAVSETVTAPAVRTVVGAGADAVVLQSGVTHEESSAGLTRRFLGWRPGSFQLSNPRACGSRSAPPVPQPRSGPKSTRSPYNPPWRTSKCR